MKLIANQQLTGDYGTVLPGQWFECDAPVAEQLIQRGLATRALIRTYETKVVVPEAPMVGADPFRNVFSFDEEPPALVALRTAVCAVSDVPPARDSGHSGRGECVGSDPTGSEVPAPGGEPDNRDEAQRGQRSGPRRTGGKFRR